MLCRVLVSPAGQLYEGHARLLYCGPRLCGSGLCREGIRIRLHL